MSKTKKKKKKCSRCSETKSRSDFYGDRRAADGLKSSCKTCSNKSVRGCKERYKSTYVGPTIASKACSRCGVEKRASQFDVQRDNLSGLSSVCKECKRVARSELKAAVFEAYGQTCACCGEDNLAFLTLDHKDGGGSEERRLLGSSKNPLCGQRFYVYLKKMGWPQGKYQTLCYNCNCGKLPDGTCPHWHERRDTDSDTHHLAA